LRGLAIDGLTDALAGSARSYASDDDPELVGDAMPFVLKTVESLLLEEPENQELLLQACSGFTQYAYAFVELDADRVEGDDYAQALELRDRAFRLYLRARDYGLRALELRHPGMDQGLRANPSGAVQALGLDDVELAYWTAAAWGSAIGTGLDHPEVAADVDAVRELLARALELNESWDEGALHEAMISIESLPEAMGGSPERAREHYARALELSGGRHASTYLSLAVGVSLPAQDPAEFRFLLQKALAVDLDADPGARLSNRLAQRRARQLLDDTQDLFLEPPAE